MANAKIKTVTVNGTHLVYKWADNVTQDRDVSSLPQEMILRLATDRAKAKLDDSCASLGSQGVEVCRAAADEVWTALCENRWERGRGTGSPWLVEAMCEIWPDRYDAESARAIYDDEEKRKKAYKLPEVRAWRATKDLESVADAKPTDLDKLF